MARRAGAGRKRKLRLRKSRYRKRVRARRPAQIAATLGRRRTRRVRGR